MRHKLDVKPIPEDVIYINELDFLLPDVYCDREELEQAATGLTEKDGGILPDDNVRIYVPLDLNADSIIAQLEQLYEELGSPTEDNELVYLSGVGRIIRELEIYDQVMTVRDLSNAVQKEPGGVYHSKKGIALAKRMVDIFNADEGTAEMYPYIQIEQLTEEFLL